MSRASALTASSRQLPPRRSATTFYFVLVFGTYPSIPHVFSVVFVLCHCACACVRIKKRLIPLVFESWREMDVVKMEFRIAFLVSQSQGSFNFSIHFSLLLSSIDKAV